MEREETLTLKSGEEEEILALGLFFAFRRHWV